MDWRGERAEMGGGEVDLDGIKGRWTTEAVRGSWVVLLPEGYYMTY